MRRYSVLKTFDCAEAYSTLPPRFCGPIGEGVGVGVLGEQRAWGWGLIGL